MMPKVINLSGRKPQVVREGEVYIGHRGGWNQTGQPVQDRTRRKA
jgi:hypothetical protein